jgi:eukaryotic-like serine/threonine-protein kinase
VIIYTKPEGGTLAALLESGQVFKPSEVMKKLIMPLAVVLNKLETLGITHGCINPRNIFVTAGGLVLGDCVAEPAGSMQPLIYEPIEHLLAMPEARGNGRIASDMYALAMLTLDAMGELSNRKQLTRTQLIALILARGSYNLCVNEGLFPSQLVDVFRGILIENAAERWTTEHLILCVGGKRYNLVPPNTPRDSNRPHSFDGVEFYTLRSLACAYGEKVDKAIENIRDPKLMKWLEIIPYRNDAKEGMEKIVQRARRTSPTSSQRHEIVARAIATLDPQSPLRYKEIAAQPDHLSQLSIHCITTHDLQTQAMLAEMMLADLLIFWRDLAPSNFKALPWDAEVVRLLVRYHSIGFGAERLMYEMNPTMPCLSKPYLPYHVTNAKTMLQVLDYEACNGKALALHDRHLMAFIAARAGIRKELKLTEFKDYPALYNSSALQAIVILARAQEKTKVGALHGVCTQAMLPIIELIESFYSVNVRESFSADLQTVLPKGNLSYLVRVLHNHEYIVRDREGYGLAKEKYARNTRRLHQLQDKRALFARAQEKGLRTAFCLSLMLLFGVCFHVVTQMTQ